MAKYTFYVSYSHRDGQQYASVVVRQLQKRGYKVFTIDDQLFPGKNFRKEIADNIANSDCFIPIITEQYDLTPFAMDELNLAMQTSRDRSKAVLPLVFSEGALPETIQAQLQDRPLYRLDSISQVPEVVGQIHRTWGMKKISEMLYDQLLEYQQQGYQNRSAQVVCDLLNLLLDQWTEADHRQQRDIAREICRLYQPLMDYAGSYDQESRQTAQRILDMLVHIEGLWASADSPFHTDPFLAAFAVRALHAHQTIWVECADILSDGGRHNAIPDQAQMQAPFFQLLTQPDRWIPQLELKKEDASFVAESSQFLLSPTAILTPKPKERKAAGGKKSENDEILQAVAKYMQESGHLLDTLQKQGMAGDFLKCLLTGYQRVKNFCDVVGAEAVAADCVERILQLRAAMDQEEDGIQDQQVTNGLKSLLGLTLQGSGHYDLFISFKSEDSDMAERIYKYCQRHMKVPFWSKRTLPELSKSEYEDAIFGALRDSKHFVVVLSNLDYLNAGWIKKEMATFDRGITEGRKPDGNFVFVVTDDVYRQIIACNKSCLDERYCGYLIIKMSEFEEGLLPYLS